MSDSSWYEADHPFYCLLQLAIVMLLLPTADVAIWPKHAINNKVPHINTAFFLTYSLEYHLFVMSLISISRLPLKIRGFMHSIIPPRSLQCAYSSAVDPSCFANLVTIKC